MMNFSSNSSNFNLPQNLRALRKRMKLSQEELADRLGLNRGNIASYESGMAEPKICNLVKFAQLFNISIFDLTHSNLEVENSYQQATQRHLNEPGFPAIGEYINEAKEFESAVKGLECIFKMKVRNTGELSEDAIFFKNQFEQLCSVSAQLLKAHFELIATIKSKCPDHKAKENSQPNDAFNA